MLKDFFSNVTILIASFTVMGQVFKNMPLSPSSSHSTKLYWGICYGVLGNILMLFSFQINPTTIADLRHLAIAIAAAFGGVVPAIIASVFIALGRVTLFGFTETAFVAAISALLTGIVCGWFSKLNIQPTLKAISLNLIGLFFISIVFAIYDSLSYFLNWWTFRLSIIGIYR
jgi:diguanylate cyclase